MPATRLCAAAIVASLALGCDADRTAAPAESAVIPITAPAAQVSATRGAIADLATRVLPGSERLAASGELTDAIEAVNRAMERGNAAALTQSLTRADRAVARLAQGDAIDGPELDAIRLALADARRLVEPAPEP